MSEKQRKMVYSLLIGGFVLIAAIFFLWEFSSQKKSESQTILIQTESAEAFGVSGTGEALDSERMTLAEGQTENLTDAPPLMAAVYVCGAVTAPGVYYLPETFRVHQAIEAAGGFLETADTAALNLAEVLQDGEQIYVPVIGESIPSATGAGGQTASDGKVNINTADRALLMTLSGIGEAKADAILAYRQSHGSFTTIEDIMQVSGIKEAAFSKIQNQITVQ